MAFFVLLMGLVPVLAEAKPAGDKSVNALGQGILAYNDGELKSAEKFLRAAIKTAATSNIRARAWLFLGLTQAAGNRIDAARTSFRLALTENPKIAPDPRRIAPPVLRIFDGVLRGLSGTLEIEASEPQAKILVGGALRGKAPARLRLPPGRYQVRIVSADGNRAAAIANVRIRPGTTTKLAARLVPLLGKVSVHALPAQARVEAPGAKVEGSNPALISLPAGRHRLKVWAPGFRASDREIVVRPSETLDLRVELRALPKPWYRRRSTWGWITLGLSAASATAGLLVARSAQSSEEAIRTGQRDGTLDYDRFRVLSSGIESNQTTANVLLGVAGAAAITSLVLILIGDRAEGLPPRRTGWRVVPTVGGAAVAVRF